MIDLTNFSFDFGGRYLYKDTNWNIKPGDRFGLIGKNGTGKSTLLRVMTGEYSLTSGVYSKPKDVTIGFLNQDLLSYESHDSILNVALQAFSRVLELEKDIANICERMVDDHSDAIMQELSTKQTEYESLDGYNIHHKTEEVLEGLGFTTADLQKPLSQFSGGWRMRVMLAKLLLQKPDLLLLDEPTNHLDLPSIEWLEEYVRNYEGSVVVVSHDRYFLDKVVNKIAEVSFQKITVYPGNYEYYMETKAERDDLQQKAFDNQQNYIRQQERFIERFKAKASKATAAQSRQKLLDKLERVDEVQTDDTKINLQFKVTQQSGKVVSELKDVSKRYGDNIILDKTSGQIIKGDKIALIGANGKGKSTLLRIVAGQEQVEGQAIKGYNVREAFYAQHQLESLNVNYEILEELQHFAADRKDQELRTVLGCFLFTGDDVFKKIRVLSGGEKARVALAKTLLSEANFLLLDEPTNHLDMQSINILIQSLQQYEGSFLVVSHDRHFVSHIANKIWWIENHELKEFVGTYDEYEEWRKRREAEEKAKPAAPVAKVENKQKTETANKPVANRSDGEQKKLTKELAVVEREIATLKASKEQLEGQMAQPENISDAAKMTALHTQYSALLPKLEAANGRYEAIFEQLLAFEA
jgi:ATP-binding cassette, subfamily F, member 3